MMHFLSGIKEGFKEFGENIALIINSILLSLVYFLGIGTTSLIARIIKKSFLDVKIEKKTKTYWSDFNLKKRPEEEYYRQF